VLFREVQQRLGEANRSLRLRDAFRIVHFSVQDNHLHLIVEARDSAALSRGVQGFAIRVARRVNGLLGIRGSFWGDRFHSRELASPRAVRNAIVYVLMNAKKHGFRIAKADRLSSAAWFDGFAGHHVAPDCDAPVRPPRTWLGATGWRRHGLVRLDERPRAPR
jgi:REP element-mobilizing transposase RayT